MAGGKSGDFAGIWFGQMAEPAEKIKVTGPKASRAGLGSGYETSAAKSASMHHPIASLVLIFCLVATAGCAKKLAPQDVARMRAETYNSGAGNKLILSVQCEEGERGWDYICVDRFTPNPLQPDKYAHPMSQRVGLIGVTVYEGRLGSGEYVIAQDHEGLPGMSAEPIDGPIPSPQELFQLRKKQNEAAEARRKAAD